MRWFLGGRLWPLFPEAELSAAADGKVQSQELLGRHPAAWEVRPGAEGAPGGKTAPRKALLEGRAVPFTQQH